MSVSESSWRDWLAKADNDLLNIRNNIEADQTPWDTVCFHAQQAAEKALKAFLVARGEVPPHSHDLVYLLAICEKSDAAMGGLAGGCERLTYYGVHVRYPGDIYEPSEIDGRELNVLARNIVEVIRARLES